MITRQATVSLKSCKESSFTRSKKKTKLKIDKRDILNTPKQESSKLKRQVDHKIKTEENTDYDSCSPEKVLRKNGVTKRKSDIPRPLPSREKEIEWLQKFLMEHYDKEESASLYISGQPGTGKSASLSYILQLPQIKESFKQVYVNCTMMKSAASIYTTICKELQLKTCGSTAKACCTAIENYLNDKHKMILLVLDEIDQLNSKRQEVLYTIFEWPTLANSRLVLIGVANALDLTERTLPRLQARCSLRPTKFQFAPYTKDQIVNILTNILVDEDKEVVFSPVALQMLAAKISAVSGDMRRALDIGRHVIEVARRSFGENQRADSLVQHSTVTVEGKQVLEVLNDMYGGCKKIETDVEKTLPMHQKLILCSLMLMLTKGNNKNVVMGKLHDVYKRVAQRRNITPLDMIEMCGACSLLEAHGALRVAGGAAVRSRRVRLHWDEDELAAALRDKPLLTAILADTTCLTA